MLWTYLIQAVGDIEVGDFGYAQAEDFRSYLCGRYPASTVVSYMKSMQAVLNWSSRRGYRIGDAFAGVTKPKVPQSEIRVFDQAEVDAILAAAGNQIWKARIMTSLSAGLRRSENLNLTIRDIDFDKGFISIQSKKASIETWPWTPKNYEIRRVPLTESLAAVYTRLIAELPAGQPYFMLTERTYWRLRRRREITELPERIRTCPDQSVRYWRHIQSLTGTDGTFHDLRRTCISRWSWQMAPQEVKKLAGHADIDTTMRYYAAVRGDVLQRASKCSIC